MINEYVYIAEARVDYEPGDILGVYTSLHAAKKAVEKSSGDYGSVTRTYLNTDMMTKGGMSWIYSYVKKSWMPIHLGSGIAYNPIHS